MRTTAVLKDDKYILNGSKTFITNGVYSDYLIVAAKTDPEAGHRGMSIFVVDRDTPGIHATKLDKLGWRASDTAEISFDNVEIPAENLDRKSTRLNSSHVAISYAVFCLKKKKRV